MASRIKGITVEIGGDTTGLDKAMSGVNKNLRNTQSALNDVNRLLKLDPTNTELLSQKQKLLQSAISDTTEKLDALKNASAQLESKVESGDLGRDKFDALQREIIATEQKLNGLKSESAKTDDALNGNFENISKGAEEAASGIGKIEEATSNIAGMQAAEVFSDIANGLKDLGASAIETAREIGDIGNQLAANLDITADGIKDLKKITEEVFATGFTDDINEATQAVQLMWKSFGEDVDDSQLKSLSTQLLAISKRTGTDLQDNIRGTSQLMDAFGLDAQRAFDLMAAGYQWNLNESGDFMDTLNEYAPLFKQAGFSAEDMFNILNNGMRNGAINTDKVADAVKEFQIKLGDGSFDEPIKKFSKETQKTFEQWKKGKATVADVAENISNDMQKMSPTEQQQALSLLSSQFEDLGIDATRSLFIIGDGLDDITGKAESFANAAPGEEWQGTLNRLQLVMADLGTRIMSTLQPVLDFLIRIVEKFAELPGPVQDFIVILGILITVLGTLAPIIAAVSAAITLLNVPLLAIVAIIALVAAAITGLIYLFKNWDEVVTWFKEKWSQFTNFISETWNNIKNWFNEGIEKCKNSLSNLNNNISSTWDRVKTKTSETWQNVKNTVSLKASEAKEAAVNGFWNLVNGVASTLSNLVYEINNTFQNIKSTISGWASAAWNWGYDFITGLTRGFVSGMQGLLSKVRNLASSIRSYLHFSRPDVGPLRDYETWMPDFMAGMAKGIDKNMYRVTDAVQRVANAMQMNMPNMNAALAVSGSGVNVNNAVTVQIGNKQFEAYIVNTAQKGISHNQRAGMRAKGA